MQELLTQVHRLIFHLLLRIKIDMPRIDKHIQTAIKRIKENEFNPNLCAHMSAIIVKGGKIVSIGRNKPKMNTYIKNRAHHENCASIHAEIDAIFKVRRKIDLKGCDMYVARITKHGDHGMAAPCPMCMRTIERYGIKRVFYTLSDGYEMVRVDVEDVKRKKR